MLSKRSNLWLIYTLSFFFLNGCAQNLSTPEWGILTQYKDAVLLKIPPRGKVTVCADRQQVGENVAQSVLIWAKEIGRDKYITSKNDCDRSSDVTLTVQAANDVQTANTAYWEGKINYNATDATYQQLAVMLHEVGHNWGLCDQYTSALWNCDQSEQSAWNENSNGVSVMGGNYKTTLAADDIKGIKHITSMQGVGQNDQWKTFLAGNPDSNNSSNSNSDSNSGSDSTGSTISTTSDSDNPWTDIFSDLFNINK